MAQFTLEQYQAQQAAKQNNSNGNNNGPKIHFMKEFLDKEGDQVVVRFPYTKPEDLLFESVHKVIGVFPNNQYGKSVRCTGDDTCPLCASADESVRKRSIKFYAKMLVYAPINGKVEMLPTIWERPAMFADNELKGLMAEYGDLSNYLFKITKSGSGSQTRYNIIPVNMQSPVYSGDAYKKDLSSLAQIDPVKVLSKSVDQYLEALNAAAKPAEEPAVQAPIQPSTPVVESKPVVEQAPVNAPSADGGVGPTRFRF